MQQRQIALLRGVNLGKHNRVPMAELRGEMAALEFGEVATHLQSGNVVFSATISADAAERVIAEGIASRFGIEVPVLVRTRDELAALITADPLAGVATDPAKYLVTFLSAKPDPDRFAALEPPEPELVRFGEREVFVWCPDGVRNTRVSQSWLERRLGVTATSRNWSTVERLLAIAEG